MLKRLQIIGKGKGKDKKNAAKPHCYIGLAALKVRIYNQYTENEKRICQDRNFWHILFYI
ncbi:hypothetical protein CTM45_05505 [Prevotella intermedia]|uniref:Uncharacterized protein n=1 Tax=Prevotella intermedia TaxID=28131 RepID=A0A2D3LK71_PREIN|nr:hypothetical protein CTM46_05595 [Prevotella intermedia]ATV52470.1 hypothetical protein CTM50_05145 [Prevotella intermedia]PJI22786.1 hypothetical protein CTM45_05505 [Prevotella intermedia]